MNQKTLEKRLTSISYFFQEIIKWYYESQGSVIAAQSRFRRYYNSRKSPCSGTISIITQKIDKNSTVVELLKYGKSVTIRTPANIRKVKEKLALSPLKNYD